MDGGSLESNRQRTLVLGDLKHRAANVLEKELSRGGRFEAFISEVGLTRNRVQQTELDQFSDQSSWTGCSDVAVNRTILEQIQSELAAGRVFRHTHRRAVA